MAQVPVIVVRSCRIATFLLPVLAGLVACTANEPTKVVKLALQQTLHGAQEPGLQAQAVRPTRPEAELHTILIEDERYLGDVARQLGATVDSVLADNQLTDTMLKPDMKLQVRTTADLVDQFVAAREARKERRAAKEAAKQAELEAKALAAAEERRKVALAAKAKRLGTTVEALLQKGELKTEHATSRHVRLPADIQIP